MFTSMGKNPYSELFKIWKKINIKILLRKREHILHSSVLSS